MAIGGELRRKLANGRRFARSVYTNHENNEWLIAGINLQRPSIRREHALDLGGKNPLDLLDVNILVITVLADRLCDLCSRRDPEIGSDQHLLQIVEHLRVKFALGEDGSEAGSD